MSDDFEEVMPFEEVNYEQLASSYLTLISECRDAIPTPEPDSSLCVFWCASMGYPQEVPELIRQYVKVKEANNLSCKSTQARLAAQWGYVKANPLPEWFDEPFIAEGLSAIGAMMPTPREFGTQIASRYRARIAELEAQLASI